MFFANTQKKRQAVIIPSWLNRWSSISEFLKSLSVTKLTAYTDGDIHLNKALTKKQKQKRETYPKFSYLK